MHGLCDRSLNLKNTSLVFLAYLSDTPCPRMRSWLSWRKIHWGPQRVTQQWPAIQLMNNLITKLSDSIRHHHHRHHPGHKASKKRTGSQHHGGVPTNSELLGSMASRLALVERELLAAKKEIINKDNYIYQLEERVAVLERSVQKESSKGETWKVKRRRRNKNWNSNV